MAKKSKRSDSKLRPTQKLTLFFFRRPRKTALIWVLITLLGIFSYTTLLKREGFPTINTPFAIVQGTYAVHDPAKVDNDVAKPLNAYLLKQDGVKKVQAQSFTDFYTVIVNYDEGVDAKTKSRELQQKIETAHILPARSTFNLKPFEFGVTSNGDDIAVAFYADKQMPTEQLVAKAKQASEFLNSRHM